MTLLATPSPLETLLLERDDPLVACGAKWLKDFRRVPDDAALPLAMSGPHPRAVGSYGAECIAWAKAEMGITLRWWQALAVTRQLEHDKDGALVWREVVESGPRRIGKSVRLRVVALWRTAHADLIGEPQLSMLVSKDLAVGKEIHRGAWRWAEQKNWKVIRLNGGQEIEAPDESRWLLRADTAVYGYDVGYGQVDESWGVDPQSITDGLEPALLERLWAQLHLTSTAHVKATSLMRRRLLAALRNSDQNVLLLLWGAHPNAPIEDEATWRAASPHWTEDRRELMARKFHAAMAGQDEPEFDDPDPVRGWAAQYLNVWPLLGAQTEDDGVLLNWDDCCLDGLEPVVASIGAAVSWDRRHASIAVAGMNDVTPVIGALDRREGTGWLVPELLRIQRQYGCQVVVDGGGPTADLIPAMAAAGISLAGEEGAGVGTKQVLDATITLSDLVQRKAVAHPGHALLDAAVAVATKRDVADTGRFAWARKKSGGDISMLEAATLALWPVIQPETDVWGFFS